ncbi:MAG: hypothetical protein KDI82_08835 [Gammaproteobacteria bacterium]|nr:hypothetical protein [Gammaproteobacteria bacterium]
MDSKKVICVTGGVWTGSRSAPRRILVREGFVRPVWFTTGRPLTDAQYRQVSSTRFHLARSKKNVFAHIQYRGSFIGVMRDDFDTAMQQSSRGVLLVGPPEIAVQVANRFDSALVFALKGPRMAMPERLVAGVPATQLHRIDVDVLARGAWTDVHERMMEIIGQA